MKKLLWLLTLFVPYLQAAATPAAQLEWTERGSISVDGKLDEPIYQKGKWSGDFKNISGEPAKTATHFRLLTDGNLLYFAAKLGEPGGELVAKEKARDGAVWTDDCVELFLLAKGDASEFLQFLVNSEGVVTDVEYGQGGHLTNKEWNAAVKAATQKNADGWTVEMAIPLAELRIDPELLEWKLQVARERQPLAGRDLQKTEVTVWTPAPDGLPKPESFASLSLPEFDRQLFSISLTVGPEKVIRENDQFVLQQEVQLRNPTKKFVTAAIRSFFDDEPEAVVTTPIAVPAGESVAVTVALPVRGEIGGTGFLRHELALASAPDNLITVATQPVRTEYRSFEIALEEPSYRDNIYATQNVTRIAGQMTRRDAAGDVENLKVALHVAGGEPRPGSVRSGGENQWSFEIAGIGDLPEGTHELIASFESDGKPVTLKREIRKLPFHEGEVWINREGVVHREGKPVKVYGFAFGRWSQWENNALPKMLMNMALPVWCDPPAFTGLRNEVDKLWKAGIYSAPYVAIATKAGTKGMGKHPLTESEKDELRALIQAVKSSPGVLAYYLYDEPEWHGLHPAKLEEMYRFFAQEDPYRPVMLMINHPDAVVKYQDACDIVNVDPYPSFLVEGGSSKPMSSVGRSVDLIKRNISRGRWLTPQAFNWGFLDRPTHRGPTATEIRCQQTIGFIHGATAITWYTELTAWDLPSTRVSIPYLSSEYEALFDLLVAAPPERLEQGEELEVGWIDQKKAKVILIANAQWKERKITLRDPRFQSVAKWNVLGSQEVLKGGQDALTFKLAPYESVILTSEALPLSSELEWSKVLVAEQKAIADQRNVPGNIALSYNGTKISLVNAEGVGWYLAGLLTIDGVKEPGGEGLLIRRVQPGVGLELTFPNPAKPRRVVLYGTNITEGAIQILTPDDEWKEVATLTLQNDQFRHELTLPGTQTGKLRVIANQTKSPGILQIREIEVYE